jgi:hypothetical protein
MGGALRVLCRLLCADIVEKLPIRADTEIQRIVKEMADRRETSIRSGWERQ